MKVQQQVGHGEIPKLQERRRDEDERGAEQEPGEPEDGLGGGQPPDEQRTGEDVDGHEGIAATPSRGRVSKTILGGCVQYIRERSGNAQSHIPNGQVAREQTP